MTDAGFFRGTSAEQDNRFSDKEKKLLKQMRFGENVIKKVDMSKIKLDVLRPWISKRVEDLLGMEDDVIEEFVVNQLEANQYPDGRRIQINLTGFLNGKNARIFTTELWDMLLSAQEQSTGIPASIIESKQEEIKKRNEEQEKLNETLKKAASRFSDKLKNERDSPPPSSSAPSSLSKTTSSSSSNIKKERSSPDSSSRDLDTSSRRKDDGSRRQYRTRRSPSRSPPRKSRSRSRSRDRDRRGSERRDRDRSRDRSNRDRSRERSNRDRSRDRRRDRSRSPVHILRSPPIRDRENSVRTLQRERDRGGGGGAVGGRRYSDHHDRDRDNKDRVPGDRRRRSRSREDSSRVGRSQNGSQFRHPPSPPKTERKHDEKIAEGVKRMEIEVDVPKRKSSPEASDQSNDDSAPEDQIKKFKKEKKQSKKEKKKHKKHHKKSKKSKKSKGNGSNDGDMDEDNGNADEDGEDSAESDADSDENSGGIGEKSGKIASSFLKYVDSTGGNQNSEDLEKKLREKALESLKKASTSSSGNNRHSSRSD